MLRYALSFDLRKTIPLLDKIAEEFKDKESLLLHMIQKEKDKQVVSISNTA